MIHKKLLLLILAFHLIPRATSAKDTSAQERDARTACLAGDYAKGAAILSELFVATKDPVHIYNQGRCFEQNHRYEDAVARFQEYVRVGRRLTRADKADAEKHIASCQELLAKQGASPSATGSDSKEAKKRAAKKACLNGDPTRGIELLTDLYVDTNDPTFIFNQGRCYEQNNLCNEAIVRFREYLRKTPDATESDRADVAKHISDCEALLAKNSPPSPTATGTEGTTDAPASATQAQQQTTDTVAAGPTTTTLTSTKSESPPGRGLRTAGVLAMGAGSVLAVAGFVLNVKHNTTIRNLQSDYGGDTADSAQAYKTWSTVGYGAGAACLVGGGILYWLGRRAGKTVVVPDLAAERTGILLTGAF